MSQFSYYLLTIPYNSMFSVLLLNTLKYHRSPFGKTIWKSIDVLKKIYLGHNESFNQNALMMFWTIPREVWSAWWLIKRHTSLVDVIRRWTYEYSENTLLVHHLIPSDHETKDLVSWRFHIYSYLCSPYTCASLFERCFAHAGIELSI